MGKKNTKKIQKKYKKKYKKKRKKKTKEKIHIEKMFLNHEEPPKQFWKTIWHDISVVCFLFGAKRFRMIRLRCVLAVPVLECEWKMFFFWRRREKKFFCGVREGEFILFEKNIKDNKSV